MSVQKRKVTVIGTGFVGASIAYTIAARHLAYEIVLIDINSEKAIGEATDISHALPIFGSMDIIAGEYKDVKDSDIIIITAGVNRRPGETRLDLAGKNVAITKSIINEVMKHYNKGIFVVVSNPVDVLTTMIKKWTGLPAEKVIGSGTTLDTIRFKQSLYSLFNVDVNDLNAVVIGEHGETQFPFWSQANIAGTPITQIKTVFGHKLTEDDMQDISETVKTSGAQIIKNKGATYFGVASAVSDIVDSILNNKNAVLTVGMNKDEIFGFKDVSLSVPRVIGASGIVRDLEIILTPEEEEKLKKSAENIYQITKEFIK